MAYNSSTSTVHKDPRRKYWKVDHKKMLNYSKCCLFIRRESFLMRLVLAAAKSTHKAIKSSACYLGISTESVSEKNA